MKTWSKVFKTYLSKSASPEKGCVRSFSLEDVRVMALVMYYWEDDPDIEYIKICLNSNSHYDNELIDNLLIELTPFFIEPSEDMDETWAGRGVLFSGVAEFGDTFYLANSYKMAGDRLVEAALENEECWQLFCPAVYNYRHATELYVKALVGGSKEDGHKLLPLFEKLDTMLKRDYNAVAPPWFKNVIAVFDDFDPGGTTFRYGGRINQDEMFLDFRQLKTLMGWMAKSFQNIRSHQGMPDAVI